MVPTEAETIGLAPSTAIGVGPTLPFDVRHPPFASREDSRRPDHIHVLLLDLLGFGIPAHFVRQERTTFVRRLSSHIAP